MLTARATIASTALPLCAALLLACGANPGRPTGDGPDAADPTACPAVVVAPDADPCTAPIAPGTSRTCRFTFAGATREFLIYAPPNYRPCAPAPLVVDAHGTSETAAEQAGLAPFRDWPGGLGSGWRLVADRDGFLVAQPQGIGNRWTAADADLMLEIVAKLQAMASIDPAKVYMTGISNGGQLTYWTGCKDTAVFRGFAPVSGYGQQACALSHPAPLIHFHSPDDRIIGDADGRAAFQMWVAANHCQRGPTRTMTFGGPTGDARPLCLHSGPGATPPWSLAACDPAAPATTCETWDQCDGGVEATYCTVAPDHARHFDTTGGHILYLNDTNLSLAAVAWEYFKRF